MKMTDADKAVVDRMRWTPTGRLRKLLPKGGTDADARLEQLYESVTGELEWRPVPTVVEE